MKKIGIIVNWNKSRAGETLHYLAAEAKKLGLQLLIDSRAAALAPQLTPCDIADFHKIVETVLVVGGDGTMLKAARQLQGSNLPLLGLNIGSLGYLTCVGQEQFGEALQALRDGTCTGDIRTTLSSRILHQNGTQTNLADALNEVVASRGASGRLVWFDLAINGAAVLTSASDGLVISTPTGSTAYALASGGPLMLPDTPAFIIAAVSPHTLSFRPLVVPQTATITLKLARPSASPPVVSVDGQDDLPLRIGDILEIKLSPRAVKFLHLAGYNPCAVMNHKLGWGLR